MRQRGRLGGARRSCRRGRGTPGDRRVVSIPSQDTNEPFVDLLYNGDSLRIDHSRSQIGNCTPYFASALRIVTVDYGG